MKIKTFINEKPRLKKALKIIATSVTIFFAAFGVVCSGLLVGSCANQKTKQVVATTPIYNEAPIKEAFTFTAYDVYGTAELGSVEAIEHYLSYMSLLGVDVLSLSSTYTHIFTLNGDAWFTDDLNMTPSNIGGDAQRYMTIQTIRLVCQAVVTNDVNSTRQWINLEFVNTTNSSDFVCFNFCRIWNSKMGGTYTWYNLGIYRNTNGTRSVATTHGLALVVTNQGTLGSSLRQFLPWAINSNYDFTTGRNIGYNYGYQNGLSRGYNNGYQAGYEAGVSSVTGTTSNPFDLIANAFDSIAGILDIQILPGLNLGVLIFAPLVVTIIVIIVKMFRG